MDKDKIVKHFKASAMRDLKTAESLFSANRFDVCLFFCHLAMKKL